MFSIFWIIVVITTTPALLKDADWKTRKHCRALYTVMRLNTSRFTDVNVKIAESTR